MDSLLPELQFLGKDHHRESDLGILKTLVETVYIIPGRGGKEVRREMKEMGAYLVMRELHLDIEDEGVRMACEKVVDVLMIEEEDGEASGKRSEKEVTESSDATKADQNLITEATKPSEEKSATSASSDKEQRSPPPRLAKLPSEDPPSTASARHNISKEGEANDDEDDEDDDRIVEIF